MTKKLNMTSMHNYNSPVSITDIEWKLYKAELNDSEHVISRLSGNSGPNGLITLSDMGVLIMKKSSTGESAANSSTDFYIVCAENKATGAIAYAIIRAVQPIESIQINKATYAYQDIKIEYETTLSNLHMTPYGELSLEYNYFPANATYADLDFNVLNKSYQGGEQVPQKNNDVSEQFSINFTENLIKIKYKNDRNKDAIIYKYFLGTYDADFLKFSVEFKKSDSVKVSEISFVITSDITDMQIIPVDGDLNNHGECEIRDIYVPDDNEFIKDVLNMKNPALIDWYSTNLDGNTIAQMLITGYYCEANASGDLIVKSGKLPYLAAKSVCNADQLTYESAFTMCKVKPIQQNGYMVSNSRCGPNTLDVYDIIITIIR